MVLQKPKYCKNFERNSHWRKLSMIMVWERYCNTSPKPEFFLFSLFIFSFISQLIWVRLGWNFHWWFSIQKQVNWCTSDLFSLKFCTSQHSYPVPLMCIYTIFFLICERDTFYRRGGGGGWALTPHHMVCATTNSKMGALELARVWKWGSLEVIFDTWLCCNKGGIWNYNCEKCTCVAHGWTSGWHSGWPTLWTVKCN